MDKTIDRLKAKRHSVLDKLKTDLVRGRLESTVTVLGHKYKLTTLNEDDETWADSHMQPGATLAIYTSRRAPKLAAAIKAIDDVPVDQLFEPESDELKKEHIDNPVEKRAWIRNQLLIFLLEESSRPFVSELANHLATLEEQQEKAMAEIPNS